MSGKKKLIVEDNDVEDVEDVEDIEEVEVDVEAAEADAIEVSDDDAVSDDGLDEKTEEDLHSTVYYRTLKVVPDDKRITSSTMTMFEVTEVLGIRRAQIENGGRVFTDVTGLTSPEDMAIKELYDRKCPLKIKRKVGKFTQEVWKCNKMSIPR